MVGLMRPRGAALRMRVRNWAQRWPLPRAAEKIFDAIFDAVPELSAEVHGHLSDNKLTTPDPDSKKNQAFDLKKIIKGDLPNFAPVKPVAVQPDFEPTEPTPLESAPEVATPKESPVAPE